MEARAARHGAQQSNKAPANILLSKELYGAKEDLLRVARVFGLEGLVAKKPSLSTKAAGAAAPGSKSKSPRRLHTARRQPDTLWFVVGRLQ
jgi:hypothetical protein